MIVPLIRSGLGLPHVLALATIVFCLGLFGILTQRNALRLLMSSMLMLAAGMLNLVAFQHYLHPQATQATALTLFMMLVGIGERAIGLAIAWKAYGSFQTLEVDAIGSEDAA